MRIILYYSIIIIIIIIIVCGVQIIISHNIIPILRCVLYIYGCYFGGMGGGREEDEVLDGPPSPPSAGSLGSTPKLIARGRAWGGG